MEGVVALPADDAELDGSGHRVFGVAGDPLLIREPCRLIRYPLLIQNPSEDDDHLLARDGCVRTERAVAV